MIRRALAVLSLIIAIYASFPLPKHTSGNRAAIIVTAIHPIIGLNNFSSNTIVPANHHYSASLDDIFRHKNPISSVLDNLVRPFAEYGGVDVFVYIPVFHYLIDKNITDSLSGDSVYLPYPGDTKFCAKYSNYRAFQDYTRNKVICLAENSRKLNNGFVSNFELWKSFHEFEGMPDFIEAFLQEEYAKYKANFAVKEYELGATENYKFKVHVSSNEAILTPIPDINTISFKASTQTKHCKFADTKSNSIIYTSTTKDYGMIKSYETRLALGLASDMDKLLDRYIDITEKEFVTGKSMTSTTHLQALLKTRYNICLCHHALLNVTRFRVKTHDRSYAVPVPFNREDWTEIFPINS